MSSDFGDPQTVKARKPHPCAWCPEPIVAGEYHHRYTGKWEGDWQDWRMHLDCIEAHYREDRENHNFGEICGESHQRGRTCEETAAKRAEFVNELAKIVEGDQKDASGYRIADTILREVVEWQHLERIRVSKARDVAMKPPAKPAEAAS